MYDDGMSTVISDDPLSVFGYVDGIADQLSTGKPSTLRTSQVWIQLIFRTGTSTHFHASLLTLIFEIRDCSKLSKDWRQSLHHLALSVAECSNVSRLMEQDLRLLFSESLIKAEIWTTLAMLSLSKFSE